MQYIGNMMNLLFFMLSFDTYNIILQFWIRVISSPLLRGLLTVPTLASGTGYNNHQSNFLKGD